MEDPLLFVEQLDGKFLGTLYRPHLFAISSVCVELTMRHSNNKTVHMHRVIIVVVSSILLAAIIWLDVAGGSSAMIRVECIILIDDKLILNSLFHSLCFPFCFCHRQQCVSLWLWMKCGLSLVVMVCQCIGG